MTQSDRYKELIEKTPDSRACPMGWSHHPAQVSEFIAGSDGPATGRDRHPAWQANGYFAGSRPASSFLAQANAGQHTARIGGGPFNLSVFSRLFTGDDHSGDDDMTSQDTPSTDRHSPAPQAFGAFPGQPGFDLAAPSLVSSEIVVDLGQPMRAAPEPEAAHPQGGMIITNLGDALVASA